MANRYMTPVMFALEKNVAFLSMRAQVGASGTMVLDATNSKGIASINPYSRSFSANSVGSSATLSSVTSFAGLFVGMSLTGGSLPAGITIASISASAGNITLNTGTGVPSGNASSFVASGGQYIIQFGTQAGVRLDSYTKCMQAHFEFRETTASAQGSASVQALYPTGALGFVIANNITTRTIPPTAATNSTDCSLIVQFGAMKGPNAFEAGVPQGGEVMHGFFVMGQSTSL